MSFGTGHHETTAMMLEQQLGLDFAGKTVLDVGSGTGILAILAAKMGASDVLAFDIEEWAVENARENAELNDCPQVTVFQGTIADVDPGQSATTLCLPISIETYYWPKFRPTPIY